MCMKNMKGNFMSKYFSLSSVIFFFVLFLVSLAFIVGCGNTDTLPAISTPTPVLQEEPGSANSTNYGKPLKIDLPRVSENERVITFGVIADSHIDATSYTNKNTDTVKRNRKAIHDMNIDFSNQNCIAAVHLGDMGSVFNVQNLVAFRQLYENDYPGHDGGSIAGARDDDYTMYSDGYTLEVPLLVSLGNHDSETSLNEWPYAKNYMIDRIKGAEGISSFYGETAYAWIWGKYAFVSLGLWAGSYEVENHLTVDQDKLTWLKNWLDENVADTGRGVIILQHFGWDNFSEESRWWTEESRQLELDLLCNKDPVTGICHPYNVIGIFSGHLHAQKYIKVYTSEIDENGNQIVFDNFVFTDSGQESGHYGYSWIALNGETMTIHHKKIPGNIWYTYIKNIYIPPNPYSAELISQSPAVDELIHFDWNEQKEFSVQYKNTGSTPWDPEIVHLGTIWPFVDSNSDYYTNDGNWISGNRIKMQGNSIINPGEIATFKFTMTGRNYNQANEEVYIDWPLFELVAEDVMWLGSPSQVTYAFYVDHQRPTPFPFPTLIP